MSLDDTLRNEARQLAAEYMICHTYNLLMKLLGVSEADIRAAEQNGLQAISLQPIVTRDAALSDHVSAMMAEAIEDLQTAAKEMRERAKI